MDGEWEPPMIDNPEYKVHCTQCYADVYLYALSDHIRFANQTVHFQISKCNTAWQEQQGNESCSNI